MSTQKWERFDKDNKIYTPMKVSIETNNNSRSSSKNLDQSYTTLKVLTAEKH